MDDLRDLYKSGGRLTWRRFGVLVDGLPRESLTRSWEEQNRTLVIDPKSPEAKKAAKTFPPWSTTDHMIADLINEVRNLTKATYDVNRWKGAKFEPVARPRPNVEYSDATARAAIADERARFRAGAGSPPAAGEAAEEA